MDSYFPFFDLVFRSFESSTSKRKTFLPTSCAYKTFPFRRVIFFVKTTRFLVLISLFHDRKRLPAKT